MDAVAKFFYGICRYYTHHQELAALINFLIHIIGIFSGNGESQFWKLICKRTLLFLSEASDKEQNTF
jgi:hypothetical protein